MEAEESSDGNTSTNATFTWSASSSDLSTHNDYYILKNEATSSAGQIKRIYYCVGSTSNYCTVNIASASPARKIVFWNGVLFNSEYAGETGNTYYVDTTGSLELCFLKNIRFGLIAVDVNGNISPQKNYCVVSCN